MTREMTVEDIPDGICKTCGESHRKLFTQQRLIPKHPFNDGTLSMSETFGRKLPDGTRSAPGGVNPASLSGSVIHQSEDPWPFDPVLRQALINKGVLSPDDLVEAEQQIRIVTNQFMASGGVPT